MFNRFENGTDINRDEWCIGVQKINGFMASATYVPSLDEVIVSTTGSLDSPFVDMAKKWIDANPKVEKKIRDHYKDVGSPVTWMFEVCDPSDPHIVPEKFGLYLIGQRYVRDDYPYFSTDDTEWMLDCDAQDMGVMRPSWRVARFSDFVQEVKTVRHEGFVIYGPESRTVLKMKSPWYLSRKMIARMADKKFEEWLDNGTLKEKVDEEFYDVVECLTIDPITRGQFMKMDEQGKLAWLTNFFS